MEIPAVLTTLVESIDAEILTNVATLLADAPGPMHTEASTKPASLSVEGDRLWLDSPFHPGALNAIKAVPGRIYDAASKRWSFPPDQFQAVYKLTMTHFPASKIPLLGLASALAPHVKAAKAAKATAAANPSKTVQFEPFGKRWLVFSPYNPGFVDGMKLIPGKQWVNTKKAWAFPADQLTSVVNLAKEIYGVDAVTEPAT